MIAGGQGDALNLPFIDLLLTGVLALCGELGRLIRLTGLQRVLKAFHDLIGDLFRPEGVDDFGIATADQLADAFEHGQRLGIDLDHAQLVIHDIDADGGLVEERGEQRLVAAQDVLDLFAIRDVHHHGMALHPADLAFGRDVDDKRRLVLAQQLEIA